MKGKRKVKCEEMIDGKVCGKVCKNSAGLTIHRSVVHAKSTEVVAKPVSALHTKTRPKVAKQVWKTYSDVELRLIDGIIMMFSQLPIDARSYVRSRLS